MNTITEYDIVSARNGRALAVLVNQRIFDGWQPYGHPSTHRKALCQALVRNDEASSQAAAFDDEPPIGKRLRKTSEDG